MTKITRIPSDFRWLSLVIAALLAASCVACGKDAPPTRAAGGAKAQEPHPVRVVAAAVGPFPRTVTARFLRILVKAEVNGQPFAALAELDVMPAD